VEAFDLPIGPRPVGLGREVPDPPLGEQLAQRTVLDAAEGVVGHEAPRARTLTLEPGDGTLDKGGHRRRSLVGVELDIGEPRVVVDDCVGEVVADLVSGAIHSLDR